MAMTVAQLRQALVGLADHLPVVIRVEMEFDIDEDASDIVEDVEPFDARLDTATDLGQCFLFRM